MPATSGADDLHVREVPGSQQRPRRLREFAHHEAATGLEHPVHLREGDLGLLHVAQPETDRDGVELVVAERQLHRIGFAELELRMLLVGLGDHHRREVDADHCRARLGQRHGRGAGTAGDVEDALAGLAVDGTSGRDAPEVVVADTQNGVGAVVSAGDVVEHARHVVRVFAQIRPAHLIHPTQGGSSTSGGPLPRQRGQRHRLRVTGFRVDV